ncbi:hypothetical protein ScPMuIL_016552 [Solemya velum]
MAHIVKPGLKKKELMRSRSSKHIAKNLLSVSPLENLVDQAWLKLQQVLSMKEKVSLKVRTGGQVIKAVVVKVDSTGVAADPTSNCSSPSSDKENTSDDRDKTATSPKKWVPPKLLPYKYSIRLEDEDKIDEYEMLRADKPPSKELIRLFIRAHAVRSGQAPTSPWVVDESLVKKYSLPSKYADFLLSPVKMAELSKRAEREVPTKKRKSLQKISSGSSTKKRKLEKSKSLKNSKDTKKQSKIMGSPLLKKKSSTSKSPKHVTPKKSPRIVIASSSDDDSSDNDCVLAEIKQNRIILDSSSSDSDSDVPLSKMSQGSRKSSGSSKQATPKKSSPSKKSTPHKQSSMKDKNERTPLKKFKSPSKSSSKKNVSSHKSKDKKEKKSKKQKEKIKSPKKEGSKSMKQMTLLDMKKKGMRTPNKSGSALKKIDSPPKTPGMVKELLKLMKTDDKSKIGMQLRKVAICLSAVQRERLPSDIKSIVVKKFHEIEEKKKLKMMTPESRKAYMFKRRKEMKQKMAEVRKKKQEEQRKRFEDQTLSSTPLPTPKPVPTPDGLPNELFGDIAMVTEFISCFSKLLMPDEEYPIYTDALMKALVTGKNGFAYMSRILIVLLQTLLQDEISEDYSDLKIPLSDIPVNQYTVSELVRLCLRKKDDAEDASDPGSDVEDELEVADDVVQQLEGQELYDLDVVQKVQIIKGLCLRIMGSYSVQDYMEEKQRDASKLWRRKIAELKEKNDRLKEEKKKKQEQDSKKDNPQEEKDPSKDDEDDQGLTISHFYGKVDPKPDSPAAAAQEEEGDLASVVKRRRIMSAKAAQEKEKKEKEDKIKREKEYEILRKEREKEIFEMKFQEGITLSKMVLRMSPIGTDRNHNRYWIFTSTTPGLYIEKGWVNDEIEYRVDFPKIKEETEANDSSSDEVSTAESETTDVEKAKSDNVETTVPHTGQNLWFTYDSLKELDSLIESLNPQGCRESQLKVELNKQYANITKAINLAKRNNKELRDSDGDKEMMEGIKKELLETELKLRNGGLGGVPHFDIWDKKLESAVEIQTLADCLLETQENVNEKFRQGAMKTKKSATNVAEEDDDSQENQEEDEKVEKVAVWRESVENATTLSRLHVLLGMLDSCIKWEKSAENAKCKICRKKGNDERLLLCDDCNQAFHIYCLRPALPSIPRGDWFCPACIPESARRKSRGVSYRGESDSEEEIYHEGNCAECGGDEGLILCAECPQAYHLECHEPPLRHPPRGRWVCNECKTGVKRKKRPKARRPAVQTSQRGRAVKRKRQESSSEEAETSEEEESEEESSTDEDEKEPPAKSARHNAQQTSRTRGQKNNPRTQSRRELKPDPPKFQASRRAPSDLSICEEIVGQLMDHQSSWPFLTAVDKKEVPDYYKIIKKPMDLTLIKNKLSCLTYGLPEECVEDVALVFCNAVEYNTFDSEVFQCMETCEKFFVDLLHKKLPSLQYKRELGKAAAMGRRSRR